MIEMNTQINKIITGQAFNACALGVLSINGPDAQDFLQRMSSADLSNLMPGEAQATCFLNKHGRLVDRVLVVHQGQHDFLLYSSFLDPMRLYNWLEQFHFIEDFSLFIRKHTANIVVSTLQRNAPLLWHSLPNIGFELFFTIEDSPELPFLDENVFESIRIACVMPWHHEINDRFMPQNIGLKKDISDSKGCYLGQEVIAKAITYQKNPKSLIGISLVEERWKAAKIGHVIIIEADISGEIISLSPCFYPGFINALVISG